MMGWDDDDEEENTEQKKSGARKHALFPGYHLK